MKRPNSCGELPTGSAPSFDRRSLVSGWRTIAMISPSVNGVSVRFPLTLFTLSADLASVAHDLEVVQEPVQTLFVGAGEAVGSKQGHPFVLTSPQTEGAALSSRPLSFSI